jgi:hypothetical protein
MNTKPSEVGFSKDVYRLLLRAYPREFLQDYQEETVRVFGDDCRDTCAAGGRSALAALWLRTIPDLLRCAIGEHFAAWAAAHPADRHSMRRQAALALTLALGVVAVFVVDQHTPPETPMAVMYACVLFAAGAMLPPGLACLIGAATLGVYVVDGWVSPSGWTMYRALGLIALLVAGLWALRTGADHARLRASAGRAKPPGTERR